MGQNLDYLSTNQPTDEYTHKLQHRVLEMRDDTEWRENYMTWEMKLDERYETGHKAGREEELCRLIKKKLEKGKNIAQIADKGKLTLNTAIFIVAAIIVCEIVSVNALKTNMTNQTRIQCHTYQSGKYE